MTLDDKVALTVGLCWLLLDLFAMIGIAKNDEFGRFFYTVHDDAKLSVATALLRSFWAHRSKSRHSNVVQDYFKPDR